MRTILILVGVLVAGTGLAQAQRPCTEKDSDCRAPTAIKVPKQAAPPKDKPVINIGPLSLIGKQRNTLLLDFLERADEELERASLKSRSFVPELVRSVDAEAL